MIQIPQFRHRLYLDWETRSRNPITAGSYVYAEDSRAIMAQYALDDGPVQVWDAGNNQPMPRDLHDYFQASHLVQIAAHNTPFDRVQMLYWPWCRQYDLRPERWFCTMAAARLAGMPGGLDDLCTVLGVSPDYAKKDGKALIQFFCVPRKGTGDFNEPWDHPEKWAQFIAYGIQDIVAMRNAMKLIPNTYSVVEQTLMAYTEYMNDRGLPVDRKLAVAAMAQADAVKRMTAQEATRLVASEWVMEPNEVFNPASQKAILEMAANYGVKLPDAKSATLEKLLDSSNIDLLPPVFAKLLTLRVRTNKVSTAKYKTLLVGTNYDNRARGLITFYGANRTGRDSGRRFQPQNLARPQIVDGKKMTMERATQIVKDGTAFLHVENPMQLLSDCVRGAIKAPEGRKFCVADLSAIEGRKLPWLAGEHWKTQYFYDLDAGKIEFDDYVMTYAKAFGVDPSTVTKAQRQLGKVLVLACGFGGGVGALVTFAALYRIDPETLSDAARESADPYLWAECEKSYDWFESKGLTYGMDIDVWTGCQYLVKAWRMAHPAITASWKTVEAGFKAAIQNPGAVFPLMYKTTAQNVNGWLFITLPSGRQLVYPHAHIIPGEGKRGDQIAFYGVNPFTKRWGLIYTHGARIVENVTQASARDVMMWSIPAAEDAGYPVIMRVHDELITETPDSSEYSGEALARIMATPHHWCQDLPLNAVGEDLYLYQK